jgi:hypothetical protein
LNIVNPPFSSGATQKEGEAQETARSADEESATTGALHDDPSSVQP